MAIVAGHYIPIVLLAYAVAAVSAYTAFGLMERLLTTKRMVWLFLGAAVLGIGICSMHFIAMTAHTVMASYRVGGTLISLLVALSASFLAFLIVWYAGRAWGAIAAGSAVFGVGASVMHYVGMSALIGVDLTFHPLSIALTNVVGFIDAFVVFTLAVRRQALLKRFANKLTCSLIMGIGMMGLHFMGVAGTTYTGIHNTHLMPGSNMQVWLGSAIFFVTLFILALAATCVYIDRRFAKSEERYKPLFEENPDAVLLLNGEGKIVHGNAAVTRLLGYRPDEYRSRRIQDFLIQAHDLSVEEWLENADGIRAKTVEAAFRGKNGDDIVLKLFAIPRILDHDYQGVYVIGKDVTESKRDLDRLAQMHETEKRQQEAKFHTVVDSVLDAVIMTDEQLNVVVWNQGAERIFGFGSEEVIGKSIECIIPDAYLLRHRKGYHDYHEGSQPRMIGKIVEIEGKRKGGELFPIELSLNTWVADRHTYYSAVIRDISERKRAEAALTKSEQMYRDLIESFPEAILIGRGTRWVFANAFGVRLLGGTEPTDILNKSAFDTVHPDFHPNVWKRIQLTEARGQMSERMEEKWIRKDGNGIHVQVSAIPAKFNGESAHIVVVRDITELQKAREIYERSEKLAVAGELAAGIAHEIRNPLTAIKGFLQFTKGTMNPGYYAVIEAEMDRIELIISELLMVAKPQSTNFALEELSGIVLHVVKLMESQANLNNVSIDVEAPDEDIWIMCDENQIKQVVINMLKNAIEAMVGGGAISVRIEPLHAAAVNLIIQDEGPGIMEDKLANLGQPFYTTKDKGTGLGLMISYNIIRNHQGQVSVRSKANEGTTFTITLPIANRANRR